MQLFGLIGAFDSLWAKTSFDTEVRQDCGSHDDDDKVMMTSLCRISSLYTLYLMSYSIPYRRQKLTDAALINVVHS